MKSIYTFIFLVLSFAFTSEYACADGNELLKQCIATEKFFDNNDIENPFYVGMCIGLGQGVRNTMQILPNNEVKACFPEKGIDNGQATRIIISYLKNNPADLHKHETFLIMMAYIDAYPCK